MWIFVGTSPIPTHSCFYSLLVLPKVNYSICVPKCVLSPGGCPNTNSITTDPTRKQQQQAHIVNTQSSPAALPLVSISIALIPTSDFTHTPPIHKHLLVIPSAARACLRKPTHNYPSTTTSNTPLLQTTPSPTINRHEFNVSQKLSWGRRKIRRRRRIEGAQHEGFEQQPQPESTIARPRIRQHGRGGPLSHPPVLRTGSRCSRPGQRRLATTCDSPLLPLHLHQMVQNAIEGEKYFVLRVCPHS